MADFSCFFYEMRHFLQLFPEKFIEMQRHGSLFEKLFRFGQMDDLSCFFTKWGTFYNSLLKSWSKCKDMVVSSKRFKVWPNWWFLCFFSHWATFCNLLLKSSSKDKNMIVCSKKLHSVGQIDDFSCFLTKWRTFCNFFLERSWKCQDIVVCSKSCKFLPNPWFLVFFHEMRHFFQLFPKKLIKMQRHGSLFDKLQNFGLMDDFSCFLMTWGTFCNVLLKGSSEDQNMVGFQKKLHSFGEIDEFSCFFTKWGSFCNFSPKSSSKRQNMELELGLGVRVRVSARVRVNPNPNPNYHVLAFSWTFQ